MVCPVANSRLWPRLAGSIHRRALRDRFTNPALPPPTPTPLCCLYLSPASRGPLPSRVRVSGQTTPEVVSTSSRTPLAIPKFSRQRFSKAFIRQMPSLSSFLFPLLHDSPTRRDGPVVPLAELCTRLRLRLASTAGSTFVIPISGRIQEQRPRGPRCERFRGTTGCWVHAARRGRGASRDRLGRTCRRRVESIGWLGFHAMMTC